MSATVVVHVYGQLHSSGLQLIKGRAPLGAETTCIHFGLDFTQGNGIMHYYLVASTLVRGGGGVYRGYFKKYVCYGRGVDCMCGLCIIDYKQCLALLHSAAR